MFLSNFITWLSDLRSNLWKVDFHSPLVVMNQLRSNPQKSDILSVGSDVVNFSNLLLSGSHHPFLNGGTGKSLMLQFHQSPLEAGCKGSNDLLTPILKSQLFTKKKYLWTSFSFMKLFYYFFTTVKEKQVFFRRDGYFQSWKRSWAHRLMWAKSSTTVSQGQALPLWLSLQVVGRFVGKKWDEMSRTDWLLGKGRS